MQRQPFRVAFRQVPPLAKVAATVAAKHDIKLLNMQEFMPSCIHSAFCDELMQILVQRNEELQKKQKRVHPHRGPSQIDVVAHAQLQVDLEASRKEARMLMNAVNGKKKAMKDASKYRMATHTVVNQYNKGIGGLLCDKCPPGNRVRLIQDPSGGDKDVLRCCGCQSKIA
jgi:hypothetical protein